MNILRCRFFTKRTIDSSLLVASLKPTNALPRKPKVWFGECPVEDIVFGKVLGIGSFGRVHLAQHKPSRTICAVKSLSKSVILKTQQLQHLKAEKNILQSLDFPFIVNLLGYSQDKKYVHLIMEYVNGGEFTNYLEAAGRFDEATTRFYTAQILLTFEYIHGRNIVYRDLKPENLLLDEMGNIKLVDFGFAKHISRRTFTLCGTPDYLAPEIILNRGYGKHVDWWTFGVFLYEMLAGYPPFYDEARVGTYKKILSGKLDFPDHFSKSAKDLIKKLLTVDSHKRIGCLKGGVNEIKQHPFFASVDWHNLTQKMQKPPIRPNIMSDELASSFQECPNQNYHDKFEISEKEQFQFKDL